MGVREGFNPESRLPAAYCAHAGGTAGSFWLPETLPHSQRPSPRPTLPRPLQLAHAAGVPVVLDAGGCTDPISQELLRCVAVLSPNETELSNLTGALVLGLGGGRGGFEHRCPTACRGGAMAAAWAAYPYASALPLLPPIPC